MAVELSSSWIDPKDFWKNGDHLRLFLRHYSTEVMMTIAPVHFGACRVAAAWGCLIAQESDGPLLSWDEEKISFLSVCSYPSNKLTTVRMICPRPKGLIEKFIEDMKTNYPPHLSLQDKPQWLL